MKPTSNFSVFQKLLLVVAVLLCASELSAARSILDQDRGEVDAFRVELFGSNDFLKGALTLDNLYSFDYANAGIGTVIFRAGSKQFRPFISDQESPRAVGRWISSPEPNSFISPNFASSSPSFVGSGGSLMFGDLNDPTLPDNIPAMPEPSTWVGAALALAAIGFTQRRRLRGLIANRT